MHSFILKQILMDLFKYLSKRKLKKKNNHSLLSQSFPCPPPPRGRAHHTPPGWGGNHNHSPQPALDSLYPPSALLGRELSALPLKLQSQDDT